MTNRQEASAGAANQAAMNSTVTPPRSALTWWRAPAALGLLTALFAAGCPAPSGNAPAAGRPVVVTSIFPLTDWVRQVAGEALQVYTLLPPGASPHTFEPTPQTAQQAARARLLVLVGLGLDDWARRLGAPSGAKILALGESVETMPLAESVHEHEGGDHAEGGADPHVWLDPVRAAQMVARLTPALVELAPQEQAAIETRSRQYQEQLQAYAETMRERCRPYAGRQVVTMHAAFDYFLLRCGLPPARVIAPYPGKEPSARYLINLVQTARRDNLRVIFAEPQLSPKVAEVMAQEVGARVLTLDPLGNPDDPARNTYLDLLDYNLEQLLRGLAYR